MKFILSPSKLQNPRFIPGLTSYEGQPKFIKKTKHVHQALTQMTYEDLGACLSIKGKLLDQTYHDLHAMPKWAPATKNVGHAVGTFTGIVFKEIHPNLYDAYQLDYMQRHMVILCAYYGLLTPATLISSYRLDMTAKLKIDGASLYDFWSKEVYQSFEGEDVIVNLASVEFSSMLDLKQLASKGVRIINVFFKEGQTDGSLKIVTVRAKQARGLMAHYMIENQIENLEQLKDFSEGGYRYDDQSSDENTMVFIKPNAYIDDEY